MANPDDTYERLRSLEAWLSNLYKDAEDDLRGKWDAFMAKHEAAAGNLKAKVATAATAEERKQAEERYQAYLRSATTGNRYYREMIAETAKQFAVVNQRAVEIVNGERSSFYSGGYNLSAGEINDVAIKQGVGIRFDMCSAEAVDWLAENRGRINLPPAKTLNYTEDERWSAKLLNSQVAQGIVQGESIPKIAGRISNVTGAEQASAVRAARTMATECQNAGRVQAMENATANGVKTKKRWICTHDPRTRDTHLELDGEMEDPDGVFWNGCRWPGDHLGPPEEVWNCFVGETKIAADCEIVRSYKHEYSGKLITIKTAGGVNFTCTPNHPILTPGGWVSAERLHNGDDLLIASVGDDGIVRGDPDIDHAFPRIDALHEFFDEIGSKRVCALGVNFHGDVPASDVEIISKEGLLRDDRNPGVLECGDKFRLKSPGPLVFAEGHLVSRFGRISISALRFMRGFCKTLTLFGRSLGHAIIHGFRAISRGDSAVFQAESDGVPRDVQFTGDGFDGLPGKVLRDNIIDIKITTVSHIPVYNLQTENGYYFVNDIIQQNRRKVNGNFAIAHNCRCTLGTEIVGFSSNLPKGKEAAVTIAIDGQQVYNNAQKTGFDLVRELRVARPADEMSIDDFRAIGQAFYDSDEYRQRLADLISADEQAEVDRLREAMLKAKERYDRTDSEKDLREYQIAQELYRVQVSQLNVRIKELNSELIAAVRGEGRGFTNQKDIQAHLGKRQAVRNFVVDGFSRYPSSWVDASVDGGKMHLLMNPRGYYDDTSGTLALSGQGNNARNTAVHEIGHRMEQVMNLLTAEREYYDERTKGESLVQLKKLYPRSNYRDNEVTKKDSFVNPYMGKYYGGGAYELLSMGIEGVIGFTDRVNLDSDEDMRNWITGILLAY